VLSTNGTHMDTNGLHNDRIHPLFVHAEEACEVLHHQNLAELIENGKDLINLLQTKQSHDANTLETSTDSLCLYMT